MKEINKIILLSIGIIIIALILPLGAPFLIPTPSPIFLPNGSVCVGNCNDYLPFMNPVIFLCIIVIPIISIIGIFVLFYPFKKSVKLNKANGGK